jgi:hypothetical protein
MFEYRFGGILTDWKKEVIDNRRQVVGVKEKAG